MLSSYIELVKLDQIKKVYKKDKSFNLDKSSG